jgi:hypothetical protein
VDLAHVELADLGDEVLQRRAGHGPGLGEHEHSLTEHHQRGDRPDPQGGGKAGLGLRVDLGEHDVGMVGCGLVEDRGEHPTWAAPRRPPVDHDDVVVGDRRVEVLGGDVDGSHCCS